MKKFQLMVFGANPAWQKTLFFDHVIPGGVNRASSIESYAAGKGVNFCRAAQCLGIATPVVYQFAGGTTGQLHIQALKQEGIQEVTIPTEHATRCCMTCIDKASGQVTELIEPSSAPSLKAVKAMATAWTNHIVRADAAAITGSLPDGTDPALYSTIAQAAVRSSIPLLVDAVNGIDTVLDAVQDVILKINCNELQRLTATSSLNEAMTAAERRWPRAIIAITDGPSAAYLSVFGKRFSYKIPSVKVVSPIGCGDTCSAVLLCRILTGAAPQNAFAEALAAASANCLSWTSGNFNPEDCMGLLPEMSSIEL